jgi:hypothetical protein
VPVGERISIVISENLSDERLRKAFASRARDGVAQGECPDPERVWRAVHHELSHEQIRRVGLHATTCSECAEAWRLAVEITREAPATVIPFDRRARRPARSRAWWTAGALAAAAALAAIALLLPTGPSLQPPQSGTLRGAEEIITPLTDPDTPLPREACTLRWQGPPEGRWEIRVATEDLRVLAEAHDLPTTEFTVPAEALAELPAGSSIVWQVHIKLPDGRRLASRSFVQSLE